MNTREYYEMYGHLPKDSEEVVYDMLPYDELKERYEYAVQVNNEMFETSNTFRGKIKELEKENAILVAILGDIAQGMTALEFVLREAHSQDLPVNVPGGWALAQKGVRTIASMISQIVDNWKDDMEKNQIPF